jgi:hypothetical protein
MSFFKNSWKNFLLSIPELDVSNNHFAKIKDLDKPGSNFEDVFEFIFKKTGISFISLDPSESSIQLFHHCHVIGGSWTSPSKSLVSILGVNDLARPIQIIPKSVKPIKTKTILFAEIVDDDFSIRNLEDVKQKKADIHWKNNMPIPHLLTKAYLSLEKFDPHSIAQAFCVALKEFELRV